MYPQFKRIKILIPFFFLVLAATAVPVELRAPGTVAPSFEFGDITDIVENVLGYAAFGIVLGELGPFRAILIATLISLFAETSQLVMMHRDPSVTDVLANVAGATLGTFASTHFKVPAPVIQINRWRGVIAAVLLVAVILRVVALSDGRNNPNGVTSRGQIEAWWRLAGTNGRNAIDLSGQGLNGKFRRQPALRAKGPSGDAAVFDGTNYIDLGNPIALRLTGSMTITAWINSSSYPFDDAAIVSQLYGHRGYQLDTTIDHGPRTIGFKLTDSCGEPMIRYGRTPLALNTWYHLAGVYNAQTRTMDVYLNAEPDNGFLRGSISGMQRSARGTVYVGRTGDSDEFNFSGAIAEARIYSFALTQSQIEADMHGEHVAAPLFQQEATLVHCGQISDPDDKEIPLDSAILGILAAVAIIGVWPSLRWPFMLLASLATGLLLITVSTYNLPAFNTWMLPLLSLVGGASIAFSVIA